MSARRKRVSGSPSAVELRDYLFVSLRNALEEGYFVAGQREFASWAGRPPGDPPRVDLAVRDGRTGRLILVEVKGSTEAELPLAAVAGTLALKDAYKELDPRVVLVSLSPVGPPLARVLEENGVELVGGADPELALARLVRLVRAAT